MSDSLHGFLFALDQNLWVRDARGVAWLGKHVAIERTACASLDEDFHVCEMKWDGMCVCDQGTNSQ